MYLHTHSVSCSTFFLCYKSSVNNVSGFNPLPYLSALLFLHLHQPPKGVKLVSVALAGKNLRKQQVYDIVLGKEIFNVKI